MPDTVSNPDPSEASVGTDNIAPAFGMANELMTARLLELGNTYGQDVTEESLAKIKEAIFSRSQTYQPQKLPRGGVNRASDMGNPAGDLEIAVSPQRDDTGEVTAYKIDLAHGYDGVSPRQLTVTHDGVVDEYGEPVAGDLVERELGQYRNDSRLLTVKFATGRSRLV